jgi:hypothetical protein
MMVVRGVIGLNVLGIDGERPVDLGEPAATR